MSVHIYRPEVVEKKAIACTCSDCGKRTRMLFYSYEWFAPDMTCVRCGRSFNEDGWVPLPFVRGAREREIARAKDKFRRTTAIGLSEMIARANVDEVQG